jgi:hypothetical protein
MLIMHPLQDKRTVPPSSPVAAPKSSPIGKPAPPKSASASKPLKRSSPTDETGSKKRRKTSALKNESEHGLKSSKSKAKPEPPKDQAEPPKATKFSGTSAQTTNGRPNKESETSLSDVPDDIDEPSKTRNEEASPTLEDGAGDSESELSELLDEPPMRKRKQKSSEPAAGKKKTKAPKPTGDADMDPDAVEIKRLQGWLVKCGIRKLWGKELRPYETSNAKIKHLREMLSEAGMTGRYSIEKATQIKEARELAADIEAVQEGAERWGKSDKLEDDECPKRRLVRGAKNYDFLSSDGEETD